MAYRGEDMIGDDGYGTWSVERLDEEYRKLKAEVERLMSGHLEANRRLAEESRNVAEDNIKLKAEVERLQSELEARDKTIKCLAAKAGVIIVTNSE